MARNMMTVLREYNENYFSKSYKTEEYEYPNYNNYPILPRYAVTISVADGTVEIAAFPERRNSHSANELRISVSDPSKEKTTRYFTRIFNRNNQQVEEILEIIFDILCDFAPTDYGINDVVTAFVDNLPWM